MLFVAFILHLFYRKFICFFFYLRHTRVSYNVRYQIEYLLDSTGKCNK